MLALLAFAACVRRESAAAMVNGGECTGCHAAHHVTEGSCETCHRGDDRARRIQIAHHRLLTGKAAQHRYATAPAVVEGGRLVAALACRRCHVIGGNGNRLATSLDQIGGKREQRSLARSIGEPVANMPSFGLDEPQAESVIAHLLHHADQTSTEAPYRVHFTRRTDDERSAFDERCGGCHRALLE
ncbi:MAG: selenite/tellurite reduction operon c-type cytochrome lipoprotein ExtS, partial [Minisyncoccota bacterium]